MYSLWCYENDEKHLLTIAEITKVVWQI